MSIEVLREEVHHLIDSSDYDAVLRAKEALLNGESSDWWDDLPHHVQESLERARAQALAGGGTTHEEFKKQRNDAHRDKMA